MAIFYRLIEKNCQLNKDIRVGHLKGIIIIIMDCCGHKQVYDCNQKLIAIMIAKVLRK